MFSHCARKQNIFDRIVIMRRLMFNHWRKTHSSFFCNASRNKIDRLKSCSFVFESKKVEIVWLRTRERSRSRLKDKIWMNVESKCDSSSWSFHDREKCSTFLWSFIRLKVIAIFRLFNCSSIAMRGVWKCIDALRNQRRFSYHLVKEN